MKKNGRNKKRNKKKFEGKEERQKKRKLPIGRFFFFDDFFTKVLLKIW